MKLRLITLFALVLLVGCSSDDGPTAPSGADADLAAIFPESEAVITSEADDIRLRLISVQFLTDTADLTTESFSTLDKFSQVFDQFGGAKYSVEAHTDSRGSAEYNLRISDERALAVRAYLLAEVNGVAEDINAEGYGESFPIETNGTIAGRAANRRVEIIIHVGG